MARTATRIDAQTPGPARAAGVHPVEVLMSTTAMISRISVLPDPRGDGFIAVLLANTGRDGHAPAALAHGATPDAAVDAAHAMMRGHYNVTTTDVRYVRLR